MGNSEILKQGVVKAIVNAFGKTPLACDGMLMVRVEDYDELIKVIMSLPGD